MYNYHRHVSLSDCSKDTQIFYIESMVLDFHRNTCMNTFSWIISDSHRNTNSFLYQFSYISSQFVKIIRAFSYALTFCYSIQIVTE